MMRFWLIWRLLRDHLLIIGGGTSSSVSIGRKSIEPPFQFAVPQIEYPLGGQ